MKPLKSNERRRLWVDPEFAKMIKKNAIDDGSTVIKYTRKIGQGGSFDQIKEDYEKQKKKPKFRF